MPNSLDFTFSDLVAGYVTRFDADTDAVHLQTADGRPFVATLTSTTTAERMRNLGEQYADATAQVRDLMQLGRLIHAYGVYYPEGAADGPAFEAKHILVFGEGIDEYRFESKDWWVDQIHQLAEFYLTAQFGPEPRVFDWHRYRTNLGLDGVKNPSGRQETDTISRLVYGLATAYLMTGEQACLDAAESGAHYMIDHLCWVDRAEAGIAYWYHAIDIAPDGTERQVLASEFGDDYDAIPCYEQIYALAGITQVYRITGDPALREIIDLTIALFHKHFEDKTAFPDGTPRRGYYSHLDPVTLDPLSPSLDGGGRTNRDRKNWNSVGDHIPAYLINLYLATGDRQFVDFLVDLADTIVAHFPDYEHSPFVQEKFFGDWAADREYGQQKNRAIVGHNLKIAWNLTRVNNIAPKAEYVALAEKIAALMPAVGSDRQRGGWYDMVERELAPGQRFHRLVWHDRKAWWQQEQGILAYQILDGVYAKPEYQRIAREGTAFYNAWMLDTAAGGVFFNVLASGVPYALGGERSKGSHSMAMYHTAELAFLSAVYTNLLRRQQGMDFWFAPNPGAFGGVLRVAPDLLPPKSVKIMDVTVNGVDHDDFDAAAMTVNLPQSTERQTVRVRLAPIGANFSADLIDTADGIAHITLVGALGGDGVTALRETVDDALAAGCRTLVLDVNDLVYLHPEGVRYLSLTKQHTGFDIQITGADGQVATSLADSRVTEERTTVGAGSAGGAS